MLVALALALATSAALATGAEASGSAQGPPAGPKSPPFTQCPAIGLDTTCQYLIDVTSTNPKEPPKILKDSSQTFYDGGDDVTVAVQNDTTSPLGSIHVGILESGDNVFGLDGDGLCSESIFPKPEECPFGPSLESPFDYYGPDTSFAIESTDAGTVDFNTALAPGQFTYFTLEAPPSGTSIAAGAVNDTVATNLIPENPSTEFVPEGVKLPSPGNVTDTARILGPKATGKATGKVEYLVYEDPECAGPAIQAGKKTVTAGEAEPSDKVGEKLANNKSYYWKVVYSGDVAGNEPAESVCGDEVMTFGTPTPPPASAIATVLNGGGQVGSSITVTEGTAVTDTALITAPGGQPVTGRLTYAAYPNELCFGKSVTGLGGGGATTGAGPSTNAVKLPVGKYYFRAFYSGNGALAPASTACGSEVLTVVAKAPTPPPPVPNSTFKIKSITVNSNGTVTIVFVPTQNGQATLTVTVPTASISRKEALAAKKKKCKSSQIKLKGKCLPRTTVSGSLAAPGLAGVPLTLTVKPSNKVTKALKKGRTVVLTATLSYKSSLGGPASAQQLIFKVKPRKHKKH
ncbi:MAG TPA: hypothetical protein VKG82_07965 [Solirubrobacteraceae bacterium]|nr:hypothetical protein [Solirubrobacteraceae bacterium]